MVLGVKVLALAMMYEQHCQRITGVQEVLGRKVRSSCLAVMVSCKQRVMLIVPTIGNNASLLTDAIVSMSALYPYS